MAFRKGSKVAWDWGSGTARGKVAEVYRAKVTLTIKGTEVTRNATKEDPAYRVTQEDGDEALKSGSELRRA